MQKQSESHSQNSEDVYVLNHFGDYKGNLLEIGANEGVTFSNSKLLIENGWNAWLVEPGETYKQLYTLHKDNGRVHIYNIGIGDKNEVVKFYESGAHVPDGTDRGLVSTLVAEQMERWKDVEFTERFIKLETWKHFYNRIGNPKFDFISIDAEGYDLLILEQMDLDEIGCKCLCVEWNSIQELAEKFVKYCKGYKVAHANAENIIFVKE